MKLTSGVIKDIEVENGMHGTSFIQGMDSILMSQSQLDQFLRAYQSARIAALVAAGEALNNLVMEWIAVDEGTMLGIEVTEALAAWQEARGTK